MLTHDAGVAGPLFGLWKIRVHRASADRLRRHGVPRLVELYAQLGRDFDLSIDIKDPAAAEPMIELSARLGTPPRTWLCSPNLEDLRTLRAKSRDVRLVHSTSRRRLPDSMERHAADLAAAGVDALNLHHSEWTKGLVGLFHRFDVRAFAWDVQEVRYLHAMLGYGIDALYCDHVERMVATVAEWSEP